MKILILYASAGLGHKKAAEAVYENLLNSGSRKEDVTMLDSLDLTNPFFKSSYGNIYFYLAKYLPAVWGFFYDLLDVKPICRFLNPFRHLFNWFQSSGLRNYVIKEQFDVICSTHFFSPEVLGHLKLKGKIHSRLVTVVTDFCLHAYWVNAGTDIYAVMAESTKEEIVAWGVPPDSIFVTGIPVMSKFLKPLDRNFVLSKYGLSDNVFTILMTSGSFGIGPTIDIIEKLEGFRGRVQCVVVCGNNKELFKDLSSRSFAINVKVLGFVNTMEELMSVADVMIAKPGGITTCESLIKGVVMIVSCPIPGQESRNANFLKRHNAAYEIDRLEETVGLVKKIIEAPETLNSAKESIRLIAKPNASRDVAKLVLGIS